MKLALLGCIITSALAIQAPSPTNDGAQGIANLIEQTVFKSEFNRSLVVEPGVRAVKLDAGYRLSTYDGSKLQLKTAGGTVALTSPADVTLISEGWVIANGTIHRDSAITASRSLQDDTDTNLKSMQESAKKLKTKNNANQDANQQPTKKLKYRYLFAENPNPTAELFSKQAIQQLTHLSPIGF